MATATWNVRTSLIPLIGLLVLAGMVSGAGPAWAQLDCPLPEGVTPPAAPRVTAQQVEDGSASLTDFALAARDRFSDFQGTVTQQQLAYVRCLVRQEGSPWRSGSTYLVRLTPDGRVYGHSKDMSLSGRRLTPAIYGAILDAVGIAPAAMTSPAAFLAVLAAAVAGDGGPFNVPAVPGAFGYATAYFAVDVQRPNLLVVGFDVGEPHLVPIRDENIDYGDPPITAQEVVDRATLKAFVTAGGEYFIEFLESGDLAAAAKARIGLRDADGPWRHGPTYLAIMELASRQILFHGAFPDRFELRQGGIARDVATGELVVEQLIAAAESGPEGGFWLYHFDSPADDTDSADIPKLGYARVFTTRFPLPDGSTVSTNLIVNSGFYLTSDSVFVQRLLEALEDGQTSMTFGITTLQEGDVVAGDAVAVSVTGAPTDTVHFAYRLAGLPEAAYTYLGAAANREGVASFDWDTLDLRDDDYELAGFYTEDDGYSVIYDAVQVNVDNVGDGGCAALPLLPGGRVDPVLPALVGLALAYLMWRRQRPNRQAALA